MLPPSPVLRRPLLDRRTLVQWLADAYADAARRDAPMRAATDALEAIRDAISGGDAMRAWWVLDGEIGRAFGSPLQPALLALRSRVLAAIAESHRLSIAQALEEDPAAGHALWIDVFASAFAHWRVAYLRTVAGFELPAPVAMRPSPDELRTFARLAWHERWPEIHDGVMTLADRQRLPATRARLLAIAGQIQLHRFRRAAKARALFDEAQALSPEDPDVLGSLGQWWEQWGDRARAKAEYYRRQIALAPGLPDGYVNLASALVDEGDLSGAEAQYQQALINAPGTSRGYSAMIDFYGRADLYTIRSDTIAELRQRFLALVPEEEAHGILSEADTHRANGRYEAARAAYDRVLARDPGWLRALTGRGRCAVVEAAALAPDDPRRAALHAEARTYYQRAVEVAPRALDGYWELSFVAEAEGRIDEALAFCRQAMQCHPDWDVATLVRMADLKRVARRYGEAEADLRQAFERDPANRDGLGILALLGDDLAYEAQDRDAAMRVYDTLRAAWGDLRPDISLNRVANLHYYEREYGPAIDLYRRAIAASPADAVLHSNLANALLKAAPDGDRLAYLDEAIAALRQASTLNPTQAEYVQKIAQAEGERDLLTRYGSEAVDWKPSLAPISVRLEASLLARVLDETETALNQAALRATGELRERLRQRAGVVIPGVTYGDAGGVTVPAGTYWIVLDGATDGGSGTVDPRAPDALAQLMRALESHLAGGMARYVTVDAAATLLGGCKTEAGAAIRADARRLVRFTLAARGLLARGGSLATDLEGIAARFAELDAGRITAADLAGRLAEAAGRP